MKEYIYLNKHDLDTWMAIKDHTIFLRDNIIIKNIIVGQCFISDDIYKNFERWLKE